MLISPALDIWMVHCIATMSLDGLDDVDITKGNVNGHEFSSMLTTS